VEPLPKAAAVPPVIVLRVVVRAPDLDAFITNYSRFIDGDRIFIFTKNPQQPGTRVRFSLHLASGEQLIHGKGTVTRVQGAGDSKRPPGMELVFVALDPRSQTLVDFMLATRTGQVDEVSEPEPTPSEVADEPAVSAPPPLPMPRHSTESLRAEALKRAVLRSAKPEPPKPEPAAAEAKVIVAPEEKVIVAPEAPASAAASSAAAAESASTTSALDSAWTENTMPSSGPPSIMPPSPTPSTPITLVTPAPPASAPPAMPTLATLSTFEAPSSAPPSMDPPEAFDGPPTQQTAFDALVPPGPVPSFAEGWREPLPPGAPGADPARSVPANPFSEVSDGAIDYFVEWSLEQSIGPRREATASFSNVDMVLPVTPPDAPADVAPARVPRRRAALLVALGAAAGLPAGALIMWLAHRAPPPPPAVVAAPAPAPEPPPPPRGSLAIVSHPSGAQVFVDGEAKGSTPLTLELPTGPHQIRLARERYASAESTVTVPGEWTVDLKRPLAVLEVASQPPGATVVVAGESHGRTPAQIHLPAFEQYDVQVGGKAWRRKVYLKLPSVRVTAVLRR
jgi:hypothetical protein